MASTIWLGWAQLQYLPFLILPLCLVAMWYYSYAIYAARQFQARRQHRSEARFAPPVTILKPLRGLDRDAYQNLASFCQQDYPTYQLIFGVQDPADPVIAVVKQVMADFPHVDMSLVVSDVAIGSNLKVNNLANAATEAKHALLVLADSDVHVGADYLTQIIQPFADTTVGAVTCLYRPLTQGWVANFEAVGIATEYLAGVLVAHELEGIEFALGPTVVIRRSVFDAVGGFAAIADYLADDFQIGSLIAQAGYKVVLSDYVIDHVITTKTPYDFIQRQARWYLCTRVSRPWSYLGLIFSHGTTTSLLFWVATVGSQLGWVVLGITWSLRLVMAWSIGVNVLNAPMARALWLVPLRDLASFMVWIYGLCVTQLDWRGQKYRLVAGGKLMPLDTSPSHHSKIGV